ncbi:MAG TPA: CU044_2847 family protein [Anaerolineales bacterium]|nr:CU044_2847 family protein [Anaerolineales bacterium]
MSAFKVQHDDEVILVEFAPVAGVRSVSISPKDAIEKSQQALEHALATMRAMAKKTATTIKAMPLTEKPNTISVEFGLKLTAEGGAVLAKASVEAGINVTMTWQKTAAAGIKKPGR